MSLPSSGFEVDVAKTFTKLWDGPFSVTLLDKSKKKTLTQPIKHCSQEKLLSNVEAWLDLVEENHGHFFIRPLGATIVFLDCDGNQPESIVEEAAEMGARYVLSFLHLSSNCPWLC